MGKKIYRKKKEILKEREEEEKRLVNVKNRYFELKANISESHKEQLDELLVLVTGNMSSEYWNERRQELEKKRILKKKERVELYQKYLKNKEIKTQITELEEKINKLKGEIIK